MHNLSEKQWNIFLMLQKKFLTYKSSKCLSTQAVRISVLVYLSASVNQFSFGTSPTRLNISTNVSNLCEATQ